MHAGARNWEFSFSFQGYELWHAAELIIPLFISDVRCTVPDFALSWGILITTAIELLLLSSTLRSTARVYRACR